MILRSAKEEAFFAKTSQQRMNETVQGMAARLMRNTPGGITAEVVGSARFLKTTQKGRHYPDISAKIRITRNCAPEQCEGPLVAYYRLRTFGSKIRMRQIGA